MTHTHNYLYINAGWEPPGPDRMLECVFDILKKSSLELRGIDPRTSHMLSERSTI